MAVDLRGYEHRLVADGRPERLPAAGERHRARKASEVWRPPIDLPLGTAITNVARSSFDGNDPIATPLV